MLGIRINRGNAGAAGGAEVMGGGLQAAPEAAAAAETEGAAALPFTGAELAGFLLSGAGLMQQESGLSINAVRIIQALVLLFVAADVIVRTIFRVRQPSQSALDAAAVGSGWGST